MSRSPILVEYSFRPGPSNLFCVLPMYVRGWTRPLFITRHLTCRTLQWLLSWHCLFGRQAIQAAAAARFPHVSLLQVQHQGTYSLLILSVTHKRLAAHYLE